MSGLAGTETVITGGATGSAARPRFLEEGATVVIADVNERNGEAAASGAAKV